MKNCKSTPLSCRFCHHYQPVGRRGGQCLKLGAPVKGKWKPCSLMSPCFDPTVQSSTYELPLLSEKYISEIYSYETAAHLKLAKAS